MNSKTTAMIEKYISKSIADRTIETGIIHSLVQAVALLILSKGTGFLFILALSEAPGWIALLLWVCLNYLVVSFLLPQLIDVFFKREKVNVLLRVGLLPIIAGLISFGFYLLYYRFHFYYIKSDYSAARFYIHFWDITLTMTSLFLIGEVIRLIRDRRLNKSL